MPERCEQELCENWSGDGLVCPCALFGLEPTGPELDPDEEFAAHCEGYI